ncbi:ABC transporter permease [Ruminococcus flavefaciens]|uniref:ABC transporter permease n=1 Tax=Ruminococcus flavefaciens TaxID=1265 RepID=UPI0004657652|nr:FtsX-like permease family protein [Ruminococcus flavefaciens]
MKHLIALSMKYIRRQRLRTVLTFMCITLSAFILTTICAYGSSLYTTLYNETIMDNGSWEVDISSWVEQAKDKTKAEDIIAHHAVVDDYICTDSGFINTTIYSADNKVGLLELSDGKNTIVCNNLTVSNLSGNTELLGKYDQNSITSVINPSSLKNGIFVPNSLKDMGYSEGDTITLTVRPFTGTIDEDSDIIKQVRAELKKRYGTEYCKGEEGYEKLTKEERKKAFGDSFSFYLHAKKRMAFGNIPYTDIQYGTPVEYSFRIAGFIAPNGIVFDDDSFIIVNTGSENLSLNDFHEKNPDIIFNTTHDMKIRLTDSCDYDEALKMLFTDLGYNYDTDYLDEYEYPHHENSMLLALELKSPYAIASKMVMIVPMLLVLLIAWFIARFVIDNTFEMAVQERSTHFAAMRIMGASKTQVAFVVLNEALFYCFTAVPLGMILAVLICKACFTALKKSGLPYFEFSAKPAFLILAAFLTIIALFISAYTSAMWASRKLSPAEALNFGKPRSKKKLRKRKSKLNLSFRQFLRRYTKKNIKASKSRFVVATITMALGVTMFTATSLIGTYLYREIKKEDIIFDFDYYMEGYVSSEPDKPLEETDKYFGDNEIFSKYKITALDFVMLSTVDGSDKVVTEKLLTRPPKKGASAVRLCVISEAEYNEKGIDTLTGISYEEYRKNDGVLFNNSVYGDGYFTDEFATSKKEIFDESYTDLKKGFTITDYNGTAYQIIGKMSSKLADNAIIIPVEKASEYGVNSFDIILKVSDSKHYEQAKANVEEFKKNCFCTDLNELYMSCTGFTSFVSAIIKIVLTFLVSIWLVGILSMINSVNTSVLNRSRELMMLRSVGMSRNQLRKSVMQETVMFSATAAISGTLIGIGIYMLCIMSEMKLSDFFAVPAVAAIALTLNIIISLIAAIPAVRNLNRVESIAQAANS